MTFIKAAMALVLFSILQGCGAGGGGSSTSTTPSITITGTAATGSAVSGGTVTAVCSSTTADVISSAATVTNTDGTYSLVLSATNVSLPCMIKVVNSANGKSHYSLIETGAVSNTANITPMSNLVSDVVFGASSATVFANFATYASKATLANVTAAQTVVVAALLGLGIDVAAFDLLKASFTATHSSTTGDAFDQALDKLTLALVLAELEVLDVSSQLYSATTANAASITIAKIGLPVTTLSTCSYARSGNYWITMYDGSSFQEWTINTSTMRAGFFGNSTTYPITAITGQSCAFTITVTGTTAESIITSYFSKSGIFSWKQIFTSGANSGGVYFGVGVPVQAAQNLTNSQYAGDYSGLLYEQVLEGSQYLTASSALRLNVSSSGAVTSAVCTLSGTPSCGALSAATGSNPSNCSTNSSGLITCTGTGFTAKMILVTIQQQPLMFISYSGTITGITAPGTFTALAVIAKGQTMTLPAVGAKQNTSLDWYVARKPKNNANTSWTFASGNTTTGSATTVTSVNTSANSYTWSDGITWFINTPATGMSWYPSVTNSSFTSGSGSGITLHTNGGFSMRASASSGTTVFDGVEFFIAKPTT